MEGLTELEKHCISAMAQSDPQREVILAQLQAASVTARDHTGVGFYTDLAVPKSSPRLDEGRWKLEDMPKGHLHHPELEAGAGLILWIKDGYIVCLEGYTYGGNWPNDETAFRLAV